MQGSGPNRTYDVGRAKPAQAREEDPVDPVPTEPVTTDVPEKPPAEAHKSRKTVMVACKLPMGIRLHLCRPETARENVLGGGVREYTLWRRDPNMPVVELKGSNFPYGTVPEHQIVGGYGLTVIDADFWEAWCRQNPTSLLLRNKLLFAYEHQHDAQDAARDHKTVKSGLEAIDRDKPLRGGRGLVLTREQG
jgi:hypothetical protein